MKDERLRYEQLIGSKLQSLPVPDMQDAIWARIKTQLDLDMPTDDGDGGDSPQSPSGPKIIGWGFSVVVITLVTIFFLHKNKPAPKTTNDNSTRTDQTRQPPVQNNSPPVPHSKIVNQTTTAAAKSGTNTLPIVGNDSAMQQSLTGSMPVADDSVQTNLPAPPLAAIPSPQLPDTITQVKKGRGMRGLTDSSYRIVPKKN